VHRLTLLYREFPQKFWIVVLVSFIDRVGGTLLFPFFSLYITQRFHVGMTQAGVVLGLFSIFGLLGGVITDKFGRRKLILFGLVFSAVSTLSLGLVNRYSVLIPLAVVIGLLSDIASPAHGAMVADLLPERQRQEGFGILRVAGNMAWIIGPSVGGFVANRSFFALFVIDAVISCLVAFLFYRLMPETKPQAVAGKEAESVSSTFKGYGLVLRDAAFVAFLVAGVLMGTVYTQMYSSLSIYLRDVHGIQPQGYGFLLTVSAITVILFQFSVTRLIKRRPPFLMMALGTLFYMLGFGMFGFVSLYGWFMLAMVVITAGEMIVVPTSQTIVANFAPEDMPAAIGPGAAGVILDNFNPNLLWYLGGALCAVAAVGFYLLHLRLGARKQFAAAAVD
jgi:predicted MFS family arabinose efflux permease